MSNTPSEQTYWSCSEDETPRKETELTPANFLLDGYVFSECTDTDTLMSRRSLRRRAMSMFDTSCGALSPASVVFRGKGKTAAEYEVIKTLSEGHFARVLQVRRHNETLVMKKLRKAIILSDPALQRMAVDEMRIHQRSLIAAHPNIVTLRCFFQDENYLYYIYEYANSGNLRDVINQISIKTDGPLVSTELLQLWISEMLSVLWTLAQEKIVHRSIEPTKILLHDGHIRLGSFSSALTKANTRAYRAAQLVHYTRKTACDDAIAYWPPERVAACSVRPLTPKNAFPGTSPRPRRAGSGADNTADILCLAIAADVWGLGCIVYELLSGHSAFQRSTREATIDRILKYSQRNSTPDFPQHVGPLAKHLCLTLLNSNVHERAAVITPDYEDLLIHPFFAGLLHRKTKIDAAYELRKALRATEPRTHMSLTFERPRLPSPEETPEEPSPVTVSKLCKTMPVRQNGSRVSLSRGASESTFDEDGTPKQHTAASYGLACGIGRSHETDGMCVTAAESQGRLLGSLKAETSFGEVSTATSLCPQGISAACEDGLDREPAMVEQLHSLLHETMTSHQDLTTNPAQILLWGPLKLAIFPPSPHKVSSPRPLKSGGDDLFLSRSLSPFSSALSPACVCSSSMLLFSRLRGWLGTRPQPKPSHPPQVTPAFTALSECEETRTLTGLGVLASKVGLLLFTSDETEGSYELAFSAKLHGGRLSVEGDSAVQLTIPSPSLVCLAGGDTREVEVLGLDFEDASQRQRWVHMLHTELQANY